MKGFAMFLLASLIVFLLFAANVAIGASTGAAFLGDVGEMLVLFASAILFVVAILKREAEEKRKAAAERP